MNGTTDFQYTANFTYNDTTLELKASSAQSEPGFQYMPGYTGGTSETAQDNFGGLDMSSYGTTFYNMLDDIYNRYYY